MILIIAIFLALTATLAHAQVSMDWQATPTVPGQTVSTPTVDSSGALHFTVGGEEVVLSVTAGPTAIANPMLVYGSHVYFQLVPTTAVPPPAVLAPGTYNFSAMTGTPPASMSVDGGFGYWGPCGPGSPPYVQGYPTNTGTAQKWVWNGSTLKNVKVGGGGGCAPGPMLKEAANATASEDATGDTFALTASGTGWTIKNNRTGHFLQANVSFGTTAAVWGAK